MRASGFGLALVLAFSVLLFGCMDDGSQSPAVVASPFVQTVAATYAPTASASSVYCGYADDLLTVGKLVATGFNGAASVTRERKDVSNSRYCSAAPFKVLQDDGIYYTVFLAYYDKPAVSIKQSYLDFVKSRTGTSEFGEASAELYDEGILSELVFYKGKSMVRILNWKEGVKLFDYSVAVGSKETQEKILANSKVIAKIIEQEI